MPSADNKRIAKNTMFLYIRMLLSIGVNFYTVRVIWQVLGVDNYGIYNVVGGIVLMFAFLQSAMIAASQRFLSFELGKGENGNFQRVFSQSLTVHVILAISVLILAETVGLWFLNTRLNIPGGRLYAANWVYQCSILSFCVAIISVPYSATIVAHEHMKAYGYFGILEVILKLLIVFALLIIPFDKLIVYSILVLSVAIIMRIINGIYCRQHFSHTRFQYNKDTNLMKEMLSFAGWSFVGNIGLSIRDQGINILINMFFNVAINAAKGIASQISGVVYGFASNFQMAINPQITKKYAAGDTEGMMNLVFLGSRFAAFMMGIFVLPLIWGANSVLHVWLGDVAPFTAIFMQLGLLIALIDSLANPLVTALQAIGKIRKFQLVISAIMICNIPIAWVWLWLGGKPYSVMFVLILTALIALASRLILLHEQIIFSYTQYLRKVIFPVIITLSFSSLSV
ncbi:MAG: lipopolysaccharide biosynthesis protein, partial [Muribaculaceae bacterium]|nr:lipopolysaccharide biosynthesis protein [Muribaculaceae bacterium]